MVRVNRLIIIGLCFLLTSAAAQVSLTWKALPPIPASIGLGGPVVGVHGEALIVAGGANFPTPLIDGGAKVWHDEISLLTSQSGEWKRVGKLPRPLAYASVASTPSGVVVIGGSDETHVFSSVYRMTFTDDQVQMHGLPDLPSPSAFGSAEAIGSVVYVLGGKRDKDDTLLSGGFWSLDLSQSDPVWIDLPPIPNAMRYKVVTAVQRVGDEMCFFAFSGSRVTRASSGDLGFEMFTEAHRYTPSTRSWSELASLPVLDDSREIASDRRHSDRRWPIEAACAHAFGSHDILTFSGSTGRYILDDAGKILPIKVRPAFLNRVLAYHVLDNAWREMNSMPLGVVTTNAVEWKGRIVIPSGETRPGIRTPVVQSVLQPSSTSAVVNAEPARLHVLDYVVLGVYLLGMVGVGIFFSRRDKTIEDFFLAGRRIPWWAAGISIFGTQLSAITFMAVPATAFAGDWRRFAGSIMMLPVFVLVIIYFMPVFRRLNLTTAYEYLEIRFNRSLRVAASGLFILFQLARMGIVLLLPALALSAVTGMNVHVCIALMGVFATVYTALGGISAVIWTDVLQVVVLIGGAILCFCSATADVGGPFEMWSLASAEGKTDIFHWEWSASDMVGWVVIVGFFFTNLVPYTTDQTVIQRYLTTRDEKEANRSLWLNFFITIPTGVLFYGLGTALYIYYSQHPAEEALLPQKVDQLLPWFVVTQLPVGVAGLLIAAIFAAAMSSLDSSMNSISSAIINDFMARSDRESEPSSGLRLAKKLTVVLGVVGTAAAMVLATFEIKFLFDFFQKIIGLLGGGVAGIFLLAVLTRRTSAKGAWAGLIAGGGVTVGVAFCTSINFLLYAAVGCVTCCIVGIGFSLLSGAGGDSE